MLSMSEIVGINEDFENLNDNKEDNQVDTDQSNENITNLFLQNGEDLDIRELFPEGRNTNKELT
jgi:hypothetical protein